MFALPTPIEPMLARLAATVPSGMRYEPKWDGYRCLVFRNDDHWFLQSRSGKELTRYFPELPPRLSVALPRQCIVDGEIVLPLDGRLDFTALSERIHPSATRVAALSQQQPASFVAWDILATDDGVVWDRPYDDRRALLTTAVTAAASVHVTPMTDDITEAKRWFDLFEGAGLDGIIAKPGDLPYQPGVRGNTKVKHVREADVAVAAWREHKNSTAHRRLLGSLQLGLFDDANRLHWVGSAAAFAEPVRAQLAATLGAVTLPGDRVAEHPWGREPEVGVRHPGGPSRWRTTTATDLLVDPMIVCTVSFDQLEGTRFRHVAKLLRWRPDRTPESCRFDQLQTPPAFDLDSIWAGSPAAND